MRQVWQLLALLAIGTILTICAAVALLGPAL